MTNFLFLFQLVWVSLSKRGGKDRVSKDFQGCSEVFPEGNPEEQPCQPYSYLQPISKRFPYWPS